MTPTGDSPRRTSIRTKLLVGLAVPVLFVALISGFQAADAQGDLNRTKDEVTLAMAAGGPTTYITALLDERNMSALTVLGFQDVVELARVDSMGQARELTDAAQAEFEDSLRAGGPAVQALYQETFDTARENLDQLRERIDAVPEENRTANAEDMEANEVLYDDFTELIAAFHTANTGAVARIDDTELRRRADAIAAQTRSSDLLSLMSRTAATSFLGEVGLDDRLQMQDRYSQFQDSRRVATGDLAADPAAQKEMAGFYERPSMENFNTTVEGFIETGEVIDPENPDTDDPIAPVRATIANAADTSEPNGTDAWQAARSSLQQRGDQLISDAETTRNIYVLVFILSTLLSLGLALLISRSIGKPLMSVAAQAEDMATNRLPAAVGAVLSTPLGQDIEIPELEPITVSSHDEVADVAASINVVQQRALDLAVDQAAQRRNFADTFLNLGRRVQGLVARQLDFITELEDAEDDPNVLADLFRLDHLATRIRRNAESLVVLAGVTRRQRRGEPAPVLDAMRTALGEVDEYTRVDIGDVDHARLPMSVASDLAHILAELIENGLNFSPPDTYVEVTGRRSDRGYDITVVDHGIGMDAEQVDTANRRLSGGESFTVAPSRYMGHYVAGHLATTLGITVEVASTGSGTRATVSVPNSLLVTRDDTKFASPRAEDEPAPAADVASEPSADPIVDTADAGSTDGTTPGPVTDPTGDEPEDTAPRGESLGSLLAAHRELSRTRTSPGTADRSPWAPRKDLEPPTSSADDESDDAG